MTIAPLPDMQYDDGVTAKRSSNESVLVVGGYCPTADAGVLRDCITIENGHVKARAILTCITVQNNSSVFEITWLSTSYIAKQIDVLSKESFQWCKIGVLRSHKMAEFVFGLLRNANIKIVWDPILRSSSGFDFYASGDVRSIPSLLNLVNVITPNREECLAIFGTLDPEVIRTQINADFPDLNVIIKGGIDNGTPIRDIIVNAHETLSVTTDRIEGTTHGTGCVFAAGIAAALAVNESLTLAVRSAQLRVVDHIINCKPNLP
jgi:hydroxymethylpyrimidine/phosphomethylpyrimidine kinase